MSNRPRPGIAAVCAAAAALCQALPAFAAPVRFLATGDFGEGNVEQYRVAKAMKKVCDERGCDFVLGLGDNFYDIGVSGVEDPQFQTKFEAPYAELAKTFYMSLGNHDNSHDPVLNNPVVSMALGELAGTVQSVGAGHWYDAGNREVAYHAVDANGDGSKWYMPARFYQFQKKDVEFFALDTNTLMYMGIPFPPIASEIEDQIRIVTEKQELWIQKALASSRAKWKIVFGHHPYRSNGTHGNAGSYEGLPLTPISGAYVKLFYEQLVCPHADLLIVGHDHDLEFLKPVASELSLLGPLASCGPFVVSGAGAKARTFPAWGEPGQYVLAERNEEYWMRDETLGFFWFTIKGERLQIAAYVVHLLGEAPANDPPPVYTLANVVVRDPQNVETIEIRKPYEACFTREPFAEVDCP